MRDVVQVVQIAHYWKYRRSINFAQASVVAADMIGWNHIPDYMVEWAKYIALTTKPKERAPAVKFTLKLAGVQDV